MSQLQQQDEVDKGAMAQPEMSENEKIKQKVRKCYAKIASSLNPMGTVVDKMISKGVVTFDKASKIYQMKTNSERTFELIGKVILGQRGHPEGFIVFRDALRDEYPWMAKMIDETVIQEEAQIPGLEQHNKDLKTATVKCLETIHGSVDPKGYIMDLLYQENILNWEEMEELMEFRSQDKRIRRLMQMLSQSTHSKAHIILLESLEKDYEWLVRQIHDALNVDLK